MFDRALNKPLMMFNSRSVHLKIILILACSIFILQDELQTADFDLSFTEVYAQKIFH